MHVLQLEQDMLSSRTAVVPRVLPLLLHKELKGDVCVLVSVDGSTDLSSSAPCLKKQAGTLWSSQAVWGWRGIQSSISIVLLLFSLIFHKYIPFFICFHHS